MVPLALGLVGTVIGRVSAGLGCMAARRGDVMGGIVPRGRMGEMMKRLKKDRKERRRSDVMSIVRPT